VERFAVDGAFMRQDVLLTLMPWMKDIPCVAAYALSRVKSGGCAGIIANTVADAQAIYDALRKQNADGVELYLFHARFPLKARQEREDECVVRFGKGGERPKKAILIATQVVEQSIDLDFDLLLQRMGRMHRHERERPAGLRRPEAVVLVPAAPEELTRCPSALVYAPWVLRKSWDLLQGRAVIRLPDDIRSLVEDAYPACAPNEAELNEWTSMAFQNQVKRELAKAVTFPDPKQGTFFLAEGDDFFALSDEDGMTQWAATRYDDGFAMQAAFATPDEMEFAEKCPLDAAREILMRSCSIPRHWVKDSGIASKVGQGKLRGVTLLEAKDGVCRGSRWTIRMDRELGIIKEGL